MNEFITCVEGFSGGNLADPSNFPASTRTLITYDFWCMAGAYFVVLA